MAATDEESGVVYTDAVIDQAAEAFFRDFFRTRFGRVLMLACLVNIAAFVLMVWLGVRDYFALFVIGMIAALGPVYLGALFFYYPRKFSAALKQRLKPSDGGAAGADRRWVGRVVAPRGGDALDRVNVA